TLAMARMRSIVSQEAKVVRDQLERNRVSLVEGEAAFMAPHEILVKGKQSFRLRAESFVIATGTRPIRHGEFPFRLKGVHDSDSLLKLKELPRRLLVVGAGVIGCEYASIFARLGSEVVLADRRTELLR